MRLSPTMMLTHPKIPLLLALMSTSHLSAVTSLVCKSILSMPPRTFTTRMILPHKFQDISTTVTSL
uniref:Uncharacterized protein n=1 Tax=uncultured marine virus TaxID=186617 RepID=A0A0F7L941_9VIRU|nr:hypothetical protein [uncultured marine virus]